MALPWPKAMQWAARFVDSGCSPHPRIYNDAVQNNSLNINTLNFLPQLVGENAGDPVVTIAVPNLNHGDFLERALVSIFAQEVPVEVMVLDGGSSDASLAVIQRWQSRLSYWRSHPDGGQAAAINEGITRGSAPFVTWLNADDAYAPGGLRALVEAMATHPGPAVVYGRGLFIDSADRVLGPYPTGAFNRAAFARRCTVSQPAALIRRSAWEQVKGLDTRYHLALDYDLWWRLANVDDGLKFTDSVVAMTRLHRGAKTLSQPYRHYREAMEIVRRHWGSTPMTWYLKLPVSVLARMLARCYR